MSGEAVKDSAPKEAAPRRRLRCLECGWEWFAGKVKVLRCPRVACRGVVVKEMGT